MLLQPCDAQPDIVIDNDFLEFNIKEVMEDHREIMVYLIVVIIIGIPYKNKEWTKEINKNQVGMINNEYIRLED